MTVDVLESNDAGGDAGNAGEGAANAGEGAANAGEGGDGANGGNNVQEATQKTKTINLNVELMKFNKKAAGAGGDASTNGVDGAAGDAGVGRIESVDTTTV